MVTNKAFTIRLAQTQGWSLSSLSNNWYQYHLNLKLKNFFEKFFGDKFFQNRGISFSHVLLRFISTGLRLEVFVHDSKLHDFFSTKPSRRALRLRIKKKGRIKKLFKNFNKQKRFFSKVRRKFKIKKFRKFKKSFQSRFPVSGAVRGRFRKSLRKPILLYKGFKNFFRVPKQTLESKFKKNSFFRIRFKNVRKFVKIARRIQGRQKRSKFKVFRIFRIKNSKKRFLNAKYNYLLSRRKSLASVFLDKKRFLKKKFLNRKSTGFEKNKNARFVPNYRYRHRNKSHQKFFYKPKRNYRFRNFYAKKRKKRSKLIALLRSKKKYDSRRFKITKKFCSRFVTKLKKIKFKLLKSYLLAAKNNQTFSKGKTKKFKLLRYYRSKKFAIFNNLRNIRTLRLRGLHRSYLGRKFRKIVVNKKKKKKPFNHYRKKKLISKVRVKSVRARGKAFSKQRYPTKNFFSRKRYFKYPFWRVRFSPIREFSRRARKFVFFNQVSAYASPRFVRYTFYRFLGKFLSFQIFKSFNLPVSINFNFFPLHRAGSDFYLNFITTKLYYRYILSDIIKPIVRMSLKFYRGFVIHCRGRFTRAQIAVAKKFVRKSVSYSKITSSMDYAQRAVVLKYGTCNLRIWIRK